jgi:hypothetical protein
MYDKNYVLIWNDGREEKVWGTIDIRDKYLILTEHYGVTYGVKGQRSIPLAQLREWRTVPAW